ncbi:chromosome segregation protein Csm1/Pcs1-domain-containing protein [Clohesyomyces aquaticus]|uniref:Chromosome segregation protein Csm1/Pcs1-domain-containing protein n=1 Tax=Clohesyomyces aquaticus TaxID=1231657 RepID=A0A1Y1Z744_9PLEO|nr:chromosome segregation protein Csm1/Pcs1-domain-containing protein [Clohesyomyces aquaticus]
MPPPPALRAAGRRAQHPPRSSSNQRQPAAVHRRAGSASDTERDPVLRRKLGDMTKKFEALTVKYETLKEVASSGKESNFDQLKRKTDQAAKDQDAVIKALKQQISELQSQSGDLASLKRDMAKVEKENARLVAENKSLSTSLASTQNENRTLSSKLQAARSSVPPENKNVPGSAVKQRSVGVVLPGTAEAAKEAQIQKLKEDLYTDLTGLIVRGVKKGGEGEDVYDCLQTGRNGTLHFHLSVAADGDNYDDAEFAYNPLLDENRDKELLDILPDYLTEEIAFPRCQAAKFYAKVVDCMTKKIVMED